MKNGGSFGRLRQLWRRSAKRLIERPGLLSDPELRPIAERYKLSLTGVGDPESARARLGLKRSPYCLPL